MAIARQGLTLEAFLRLPEEEPALEYEADGTVTQKVAPQGRHSRIQGRLSVWLYDRGEPGELAMAFPELRTTYSGASYVPDVAVYRWERIPWDANGEVPDVFRLPPDIAIEIRSPEQPRSRLVQRCEWYVAHGVELALLVEPQQEAVRVFRPGTAAAVLQGPDQIDFGPVLPSVQRRVDELFGWLRGRR
jgi:Uma2 family endonuclease